MKSLRIGLMFIPLFFGSIIYIIFRSERLLMFQWFEFLKLNYLIQQIRTYNASYKLPYWFVYSFPDGLWIMSYLLILIEIWNRKINNQNIFWILIIPFIAITSEAFQYVGILRGTFDILDLISYLLGTFIPFIIYKKLNLFIIKNHEKI